MRGTRLVVMFGAALPMAALVACRNGTSTTAPPVPRDSQQAAPMAQAAWPREALTRAALGKRLWPGADVGAYQPLTGSEPQALAAAVVSLWQEKLDSASAILPVGDMDLVRYDIGDVAVAAVVGSQAGARGLGAYLMRPGTSTNILLQAPHPYFDQFTADLALSWLIDAPVALAPRALFAASVHRYWQADGVRAERAQNPADVCHNEAHEFTVVTAAVAASQPRLAIVQLHGFGGEPAGWDVVVSSGTQTPSSAARNVAIGLREVGYRVALYPEDTIELGATTNAQRRAVAPLGATFVHIELARGVREALRDDAVARAAMWAQIAKSL